MPDRGYGPTALLVDLPPSQQVTLELTSPLGRTELTAPATEVYPGRYRAQLEIPSAPREDGVWQARWQWAGGEQAEPLLVGPVPPFASQLFEVLLDLAERLGPAWRGQAESGGESLLVDTELSGVSQDAVGLFCLRLPPDLEAGAYRRVSTYQNQTLHFDRPFATPAGPGTPYALLATNPAALRTALSRAIRSVGHIGRTPTLVTDLVPAEGEVPVPRGWAAVHRVVLRTTGSALAGEGAAEQARVLRPAEWAMVPGGRVRLLAGGDLTEARVDLEGHRVAAVPERLEAWIDLDPVLVAAQASSELLLSRSGGAAVDPEERLRRAGLAIQEAEQLRRARVRRLPHNSRAVLWP